MLVTTTAQINGGVLLHVDVDWQPLGPRKTLVLGVPESLAAGMIRRIEQLVLDRGCRFAEGRLVVSISPAVEKGSDELDAAIVEAILKAIGQA
jgi:hypothetical protein